MHAKSKIVSHKDKIFTNIVHVHFHHVNGDSTIVSKIIATGPRQPTCSFQYETQRHRLPNLPHAYDPFREFKVLLH